MRQLALMIAAAAMTAATPAAAAWQTYNNEAMGYSIMLPGAPTDAMGIYRSDLVRKAVTHYSTFKDADTQFVALEIDTGLPEDGTAVMGEFEYWLSQMGDIALDNLSRLNLGMQYGRLIVVDCHEGIESEGPKRPGLARQIVKEAGNIVCPNGARLTGNMFFTQGKLYAAMAIVTGPNAKTSSAPTRFANSLDWLGANADHARAVFDPTHPPPREDAQGPAKPAP